MSNLIQVCKIENQTGFVFEKWSGSLQDQSAVNRLETLVSEKSTSDLLERGYNIVALSSLGGWP